MNIRVRSVEHTVIKVETSTTHNFRNEAKQPPIDYDDEALMFPTISIDSQRTLTVAQLSAFQALVSSPGKVLISSSDSNEEEDDDDGSDEENDHDDDNNKVSNPDRGISSYSNGSTYAKALTVLDSRVLALDGRKIPMNLRELTAAQLSASASKRNSPRRVLISSNSNDSEDKSSINDESDSSSSGYKAMVLPLHSDKLQLGEANSGNIFNNNEASILTIPPLSSAMEESQAIFPQMSFQVEIDPVFSQSSSNKGDIVHSFSLSRNNQSGYKLTAAQLSASASILNSPRRVLVNSDSSHNEDDDVYHADDGNSKININDESNGSNSGYKAMVLPSHSDKLQLDEASSGNIFNNNEASILTIPPLSSAMESVVMTLSTVSALDVAKDLTNRGHSGSLDRTHSNKYDDHSLDRPDDLDDCYDIDINSFSTSSVDSVSISSHDTSSDES